MSEGTARRRVAAISLLVTVALALSACGPGEDDESDAGPSQAPTSSTVDPHEGQTSHSDDHAGVAAVKAKPLRPGESRMRLTMPASYTPSAPTGVGTDDYRCFLLDPHLARDTYLTGTHVLPGNPDVVHHVILFRVPPGQVADAQQIDAEEEGEGWTCFGGTGLDDFNQVDNAPWLGAWAPGGKESVMEPGFGVKLATGTQIVMQVHYNLLAGDEPDRSSALLRLARPGQQMTPVDTMLLPAPVELPCRPGHDQSELCDRDAAVADVKERFGVGPGSTANMLHILCGTAIEPGNVQSCTRTIYTPTTIRGVAGHMHLLGRAIKIEVNPGTKQAQTVLDIPVWDFDNQGAKPIKPVHLDPYDTVRVTCRHVQWLRDELPSFEGQEERYVVWGEGTTDEMCLGILQVTHP
jgi:hypothetical protein